MLYVGRVFDSFVTIRGLVVRSVLSKFVEPDELGRSFSIIGIIEAIGKFIFVFIYSNIYENTLETWPGAFYFATFITMIITIVLFMYVFFFFKYFIE